MFSRIRRGFPLAGIAAAFAVALLQPVAVQAADIITLKAMSLNVARDIAQGAVDACREAGYQITAVVVDRSAVPQVIMRDLYAPRFTLDIAQEKANTVILAGTSTGEFLANRQDLTQTLNHVDGLLALRGGLPIRVAGAMVGAIGVSGAPGGDIDERCAKQGLDGVAERLEFADF
ncbi:MAG: heme-binding protein [Gammaproteobacteria bacterium]|jgi:uncharacterized protein GlcG (DUF336 family)